MTEEKKITRRKSGQYPSCWKSGPDEKAHEIFKAFGQQKNQAHFRKEEWHLTFEEYKELWYDCWERRGMGSEDLCTVRIDTRLPWEMGNVTLMTRKNQLGRGRGVSKPRKLKDNAHV